MKKMIHVLSAIAVTMSLFGTAVSSAQTSLYSMEDAKADCQLDFVQSGGAGHGLGQSIANFIGTNTLANQSLAQTQVIAAQEIAMNIIIDACAKVRFVKTLKPK